MPPTLAARSLGKPTAERIGGLGSRAEDRELLFKALKTRLHNSVKDQAGAAALDLLMKARSSLM
jgi:hypothetical protein